jgi:hypothetical protein
VLALLLDEHISPEVAVGIRRRIRGFTIYSLQEWEGGAFLGQDDALCLKEALVQGVVFVTYDRRTIPPLVKTWAEQGIHHGGIVFVDERTISPSDIGGLVRALAELVRASKEWEWQDRVCFLRF